MPKITADPLERRVMFRVSLEEYSRLRRICIATEKRSVSDLVRQAIDYWLENCSSPSRGDLREKVDDLEKRVADLTVQV